MAPSSNACGLAFALLACGPSTVRAFLPVGTSLRLGGQASSLIMAQDETSLGRRAFGGMVAAAGAAWPLAALAKAKRRSDYQYEFLTEPTEEFKEFETARADEVKTQKKALKKFNAAMNQILAAETDADVTEQLKVMQTYVRTNNNMPEGFDKTDWIRDMRRAGLLPMPGSSTYKRSWEKSTRMLGRQVYEDISKVTRPKNMAEPEETMFDPY